MVSTEKVNEDLKANIEDLEKEREENKVLRDHMEKLQQENEDLVKKASEEQIIFERSFERMNSASNVTIRPTKPVNVEPFEESDVANDVFDMEVVEETSPSFLGFTVMDSGLDSADGGPSRQEQLSQKIEALEGSSSDSSISDKSEEDSVLVKRKDREDDSSSPTKSKVKKSDKHPDIGSKIWIDTIKEKRNILLILKRIKDQMIIFMF
jgi:DNA replication initiation complex subunit (GINS family)